MVRAASIQSSRSSASAASASERRKSAFHPSSTLSSSPGRTRCSRRGEQLGSDAGPPRRASPRSGRRRGGCCPRKPVCGSSKLPRGGDAEVRGRAPAASSPQTSASSSSRRPQVELALDALGVGVLGGEEAAVGVAQVAQHVVDRLLDHPPVAVAAGDEPGVQVRARRAGPGRRASSRSGARASARRPSSGGSRRRPGRRCRPRPWRRATP